ncbi:MAG: exosome complex RNA-binding protein Csl4 [Candidatus Diapherotrites archaeon]
MAKEKDSIVFPGSFLSAEEEFSAGRNAFASGGTVLSECTGVCELDKAAREANVSCNRRVAAPLDMGSVVVGVVAMVKENAAVIEMMQASNRGEPRVILASYASLPIFNISNDYVEQIRDAVKIGDVVKAVAVKVLPHGVDLSIKDPEFGVVKAFCAKCRQPMQLFGQKLMCSACGRTEARKISRDYRLK